MGVYEVQCPGCGRKIDVAIPKQNNRKVTAKKKSHKKFKLDLNATGWAIIFIIIMLIYLALKS